MGHIWSEFEKAGRRAVEEAERKEFRRSVLAFQARQDAFQARQDAFQSRHDEETRAFQARQDAFSQVMLEAHTTRNSTIANLESLSHKILNKTDTIAKMMDVQTTIKRKYPNDRETNDMIESILRTATWSGGINRWEQNQEQICQRMFSRG